MHNEATWQQALSECENSLSGEELGRMMSMLFGLGWDGKSFIQYGWAGYILSQVNGYKYDQALRKYLLRGFGEDTQ